MKRKIIAGNWKMNNNNAQTKELIKQIAPLVKDAKCEVVVCVPFTDLDAARRAVRGTNIKLGAQNVHWAPKGAFTGEISAEMLLEQKVQYVIVGHSERRQYFGETDESVNARAKAAIAAGLKVIICVGETLEEREAGKTTEVVVRQTNAALKGFEKIDLKKVVIAYEPVWAIGTGRTATSQDANDTIAIIRKAVRKLYGKTAANAMRIQYGGSMNAKNAAELLAMPEIDGGLIGGASLKAEDFAVIVNSAK
ncbi:MAG TPA: triose-phosphate isomerase [Clostridia bacterium]|jgi:triosephosphate isomerase|nr:triose-phosphate isomerase [Clostridia bacterium]HOK81758.1 triose-phosphate isomerase [Clostridia bacterium]HOL60788.1 triose-phosphate isomerase [Clostridia bacterium]HPO53484.1 triose-phosphate isomerase [Clostridia bacterium]